MVHDTMKELTTNFFPQRRRFRHELPRLYSIFNILYTSFVELVLATSSCRESIGSLRSNRTALPSQDVWEVTLTTLRPAVGTSAWRAGEEIAGGPPLLKLRRGKPDYRHRERPAPESASIATGL
jgi:hypothetical protein